MNAEALALMEAEGIIVCPPECPLHLSPLAKATQEEMLAHEKHWWAPSHPNYHVDLMQLVGFDRFPREDIEKCFDDYVLNPKTEDMRIDKERAAAMHEYLTREAPGGEKGDK